MAKNYEFLEHTADVKFRAYGKSLEEAFANAAYATTDIVTDHSKIKNEVKHKIEVSSGDEKALLYDFIEQFVVLLDTDDFLLAEITNIKIDKKDSGFHLTAEAIGDNKPEEYEIHTHIKAMTYQEMEIEKSEGGYMLQVVIDI